MQPATLGPASVPRREHPEPPLLVISVTSEHGGAARGGRTRRGEALSPTSLLVVSTYLIAWLEQCKEEAGGSVVRKEVVENGEVLLDSHAEDAQAGLDVRDRDEAIGFERDRLAEIAAPVDQERPSRSSRFTEDVFDELLELFGRDRL